MGKVVNNPSFTTEDSVQGGNQKIEVDNEVAELVNEQSDEGKTEEIQETKSEEKVEETQIEEQEEKVEENQPAKIKIGEKEFDSTELETLVQKGTKIAEWEKKMPGFDVDKLMPDYTRKSQELARIKKSVPPPKEEEINLEELGVDNEQVKVFEKIAQKLGFVKQGDMVKNSVETQKELFIESHPEYKPGSADSDTKWNTLMSEFSLYNWQIHPEKVTDLLERAHQEVSKGWKEVARGEKTQENIATQKAKASVASLGGGKGKSIQPKSSSNSELAEKYRAMGWTEEDIKEILT